MANNIGPEFFNRSTVTVAQELLGFELCYKTSEGLVGGIISETEAYTEDDPACHAYGGKQTKRNTPMFLSGGHIYIYFIYGMYHCLNFVTEKEGTGAAVLIRDLQPTIGVKLIKNNRPNIKNNNHLLNGPSKLMLGLNISPHLNGHHLWEKRSPITLNHHSLPKNINEYERIGISKGTDKKWRFKANF